MPASRILPIRVAGWQPSAEGGFAIYGRTDQLLAGIERAVDPDADGDVLDAARVAVVGVTEPFASFPDGPLARAIEGAARLDTLVVVPAGNKGPAGPSYGSIGGPAVRRTRSPSRRQTSATTPRRFASSCGRACTCCSTARFPLPVPLHRGGGWRSRSYGPVATRPRPTRNAARTLLRRPGLQPRRRAGDAARPCR